MADDNDNTKEVRRTYPALTFDPSEFVSHLEGCDLNEAEQTELLNILWQIVVQFVDLGFGIHPVQQIVDKKIKDSNVLDDESGPVVRSANRSTATGKDRRAKRPARRSREKV